MALGKVGLSSKLSLSLALLKRGPGILALGKVGLSSKLSLSLALLKRGLGSWP